MSTLKTNAIQTTAGKPILNSTGSILQVVQTTKTNTFSTTGGPTTITGFNASITPSSTSSKVLIYVNIGQISANSDTTWGIYMFRNGTKIFSGDVVGTRGFGSIAGGIPSNGGTWRGNPASIMYLDSPGSTSAVSYTFSMNCNSVGSVVYFNQDGRDSDGNVLDSTRTASSIILMEVSG